VAGGSQGRRIRVTNALHGNKDVRGLWMLRVGNRRVGGS
jgi:hypothetical protein